MQDITAIAMGGPFGFSSGFMESPQIDTQVKTIVGSLSGYRVIQDQSRPEYAAIFKDGECVGEMSFGVAQPIHRVSYRNEFENGYALVFQATVSRPSSHTAMTSSMLSSQPVTLNIEIGLENESDAFNIYHELVAGGKTPLLRAEVLVDKTGGLLARLQQSHIELLQVESLYDSEAFLEIDGIEDAVVCKATDEFIGYTVSAQDEDDPGALFMRVVTPRRELIEAILSE